MGEKYLNFENVNGIEKFAKVNPHHPHDHYSSSLDPMKVADLIALIHVGDVG
jgi:hypothetical protein